MATRNERRNQEAGVSFVEALCMVALTALIAASVLGMGSRSADLGFSVSRRTLDAVEGDRAERVVRAVLENVVPPSATKGGELLLGASNLVVVRSAMSASGPCSAEGVHTVQLGIDNGRLWCEVDGRRRELLRWRDGRAEFSFSENARLWTSAWRDASQGLGGAPDLRKAPMVRFQVGTATGDSESWIMQVGGMMPMGTQPSPDMSP